MFANAMDKNNHWTQTENGADALNSTGNPLLNLYGIVGSLRSRTNDEIIELFQDAAEFDFVYALKLAFYTRDVRGGLGERRVSRVIFEWLANEYPHEMVQVLPYVPFFGRYDDWFIFMNTPLKNNVVRLINEQLHLDFEAYMKGESISLLAKWMPSINTSSKETRNLAKWFANEFGYSESNYRKLLSHMRSKLDVVEKKMSANDWFSIKYAGVPSRAMMTYRKSFQKHDENGFSEYIESVTKGETKINSSTLFPYDIFEKMGFTHSSYSSNSHFSFQSWDKVLEEQWKALPNYIEDGDNVIVIADTSGSMSGRPICTSVGLGIYFAERNTGQFHNRFMTFSSRPSWIELKGKTLKEKITCVPSIVENTNLEAAFKLILSVAIQNNIPQEEMPKALVVISDMEIDEGSTQNKTTFQKNMQKQYSQAGYELPNIVYWNVASRQNIFHAEINDNGVQLASGQNPSVFKAILENIGTTPVEAMMKVLTSERYACINLE